MPDSSVAPSELTERFRGSATQAGSVVEIVRDDAEATVAVDRLRARIDARRVTATRDGARFAPPGTVIGGSVVEVADADLGISVARLAVAETGSVLLGTTSSEDRLVGMLARTHAVVVPPGVLMSSLDDAAATLRSLVEPGPAQLRYVGFVTGPSRTADIERVLTIGVQGPRQLYLILVEP